MFSYFGSKSKLIKHYPRPKHDLIIEPFAGSARYALEYWERDVILIEKNPRVYNVWKYLQNASSDQILSLPFIYFGTVVDAYDLTPVEKDLIGFELCRGKAVPRKTPNPYSNQREAMRRIAENLYKIKHWEIQEGDYTQAPDILATWFIDPPYILNGKKTVKYPFNEIDYLQLSEYCMTREGQTIVCAGEFDNWLPFETLKETRSQSNTRVQEKIWTGIKTN